MYEENTERLNELTEDAPEIAAEEAPQLPQAQEKPTQTAQENARFAARRRADTQRLEEEIRKGILESDPEIMRLRHDAEYARESASKRLYTDMLTEIKTAYPDENAGHIIELGETFLKMCAAGIDAVTAYEAVRKKAGSSINAPGMGDVGKGIGRAKDYFTPEEVDRMSNAEIEKNYALIRKSMTQWNNDEKTKH